MNTGGKPLDAFELVTAMYAASGHELRKDWYGDEATTGRHRRSRRNAAPGRTGHAASSPSVANTDFLQAVSLFHTRDRRRAAEQAGKQGKELPAVTGNRQALLNLPLEAYKKYETQVERGFVQAAKFLHMLHIYRIFDLPYQSQIVPLAAILADIGDAWEHEANRAKLVRWYWNGVFGELYGSAVETRIARDFMEVPAWLKGGPEPSTVSETMFRADRLKTMRMRLSAAYKGVNALLMKEGAQDFRSGQKFDHTVFFGENVDIHHIFPQDWCKKQGIKPQVYDSIINKTPLSYRTNRIIGGVAPSEYLAKLEKGIDKTPPIERRPARRLSRVAPDRSRRFCAPTTSTRSWPIDRSGFWRSSSRRPGRPPTRAPCGRRRGRRGRRGHNGSRADDFGRVAAAKHRPKIQSLISVRLVTTGATSSGPTSTSSSPVRLLFAARLRSYRGRGRGSFRRPRWGARFLHHRLVLRPSPAPPPAARPCQDRAPHSVRPDASAIP